MIEYRIRLTEKVEFTRALHAVRRIRMRDGAIRWGLFQDTEKPERFIETFVIKSWLESLRARERLTDADRVIRDHAHSFHLEDVHRTRRPTEPRLPSTPA